MQTVFPGGYFCPLAGCGLLSKTAQNQIPAFVHCLQKASCLLVVYHESVGFARHDSPFCSTKTGANPLKKGCFSRSKTGVSYRYDDSFLHNIEGVLVKYD